MSERKPIVSNLLVSSIAAAALIGVWIGTPLEGTADTVSDTRDVEPQEPSNPLPELKVALATTVIPDTVLPEVTTTAPVEVDLVEVASLVEVPDVKRLSVWEARKQLKKQGLGFAFKQGTKRVGHEDYEYYRVRTQSLVAGERVAPGTKVTLQVKEIQYASGY